MNLAPVAGDDVINAEEAAAVTLFGTTTGIANGQLVTVTFASVPEPLTAEVQESAWSLAIPPALVASLASSETLSVDASDLAGNPAVTVERLVTVDLVLPTVSVVTADPFVVGTLQDEDADPGILTSIEVEVSGVPAGSVVSVFVGAAKVGEQAVELAVEDDSAVVITVPVRLFSSDTYTVSVSDTAGNVAAAVFDVEVNADLYACELLSPVPSAGNVVVNQSLDTENGGDAQVVFTFSCPALPATASASLVVAGVLSEAAASISAADPAVVTFAAVTLADGSTATVALTVSDGNTAGGSSAYSVVTDVTAPTVTMTSNDAPLSIGETATITISLGGASEALTSADVSATGGTLSGFFGSGTSYQVVFTPTAASTGDAVVTVAAG
ncbi:MAG: Ig-like domain-containing protein, partial [Myxococcota bacterium]